ncbi:MAG: class I poly(R)-hydroxyalkanoic acid synthase [Pseudomonadota bacterium]
MLTLPVSAPLEMSNFVQAGHELLENFFRFLKLQEASNSFSIDEDKFGVLLNQYVTDHRQLWGAISSGQAVSPDCVESFVRHEDRRFSADDWRASPVFNYIHQAYCLNSALILNSIDTLSIEQGKARDRLRFLARQYVDALSPANFAATNPEFIRRAIATQGNSITDGINLLIEDCRKGRISMSDESAFELGVNLATSVGSVIYENELIQLIQYKSLTEVVGQRPLLIVPPCINKYYILDLQPQNSFVRYALEQGNTVFLISWKNVSDEQGHLTWDDYLQKGPISALSVIQDICQIEQINALGFCIGGTLLTTALAVLSARGQECVASLTLLTTLLDFSDTGEIGLFVDESTLTAREAAMASSGIVLGRELATVFSTLRANDLVWHYVSSNYLKGIKPPAFDLLFWNADSANLPSPFISWYLRHLYCENSLRVPGKLSICDSPVDLTRLRMPNYLLAAREDHIVPWQTAYASAALLGGDSRFVLAASGHIAGVVNPAHKNKRSFWSNGSLAEDAESWLIDAQEHQGSWWSDWACWLKPYAGAQSPAPAYLGNANYQPIEAAPGRYVKGLN